MKIIKRCSNSERRGVPEPGRQTLAALPSLRHRQRRVPPAARRAGPHAQRRVHVNSLHPHGTPPHAYDTRTVSSAPRAVVHVNKSILRKSVSRIKNSNSLIIFFKKAQLKNGQRTWKHINGQQKRTKRCSTLLAIWEMQIKMRYYFTCTTMSTIEKTE